MNNSFQDMFKMLKKFEERFDEERAKITNPDEAEVEETRDNIFGTRKRYLINNVEPKIYLEKNERDNAGHANFFEISNDKDSESKIRLNVTKSHILFEIRQGENLIAAISLNSAGEKHVNVPSEEGLHEVKDVDIKKLLKEESEAPGLDEYTRNALLSGIKFFKSIEKYAARDEREDLDQEEIETEEENYVEPTAKVEIDDGYDR